MDKNEVALVAQKIWTSKDVWKAVTSVAVAVFFLTLIYGRFLSMETWYRCNY